MSHLRPVAHPQDVICGLPTETEADFDATLALVRDYAFDVVNISQFYPRPGTSAARMKKVPSAVVKARSRKLTALFASFSPLDGMLGAELRVWFTDQLAADGVHLAGHSKNCVQVLVLPQKGLPGRSAVVRVTEVKRWCVIATVLRVVPNALDHTRSDPKNARNRAALSVARPLLPTCWLQYADTVVPGGLSFACFLVACTVFVRT